jgi:DNA-binding GntR family transcriptional regulator
MIHDLRPRGHAAREILLARLPQAPEHKTILDALATGDASYAIQLLTRHYQQTAEAILGDANLFSPSRR